MEKRIFQQPEPLSEKEIQEILSEGESNDNFFMVPIAIGFYPDDDIIVSENHLFNLLHHRHKQIRFNCLCGIHYLNKFYEHTYSDERKLVIEKMFNDEDFEVRLASREIYSFIWFKKYPDEICLLWV